MRLAVGACFVVTCALAQAGIEQFTMLNSRGVRSEQTNFGAMNQSLPNQPASQAQGTGSITGKVVNGVTGEPIKGANVFAPGAQGKSGQMTTDASGQFQVSGLPAGTFNIMGTAQGYPGLLGIGSAIRVISLNAGESQSGLVLKLYPGGIVTGRIVDDGGDPMSGCSVTALPEGKAAARFGRGGFGGSSTDDRGEYRLSGMAAGRYVLEARCFENIPSERPFGRMNQQTPLVSRSAWATVFYPNALTPAEATVTTVMPGSEITGIDFQMHVVNTTQIRGQVITSQGEGGAGMPSNCQLVPYNGTTPEPRMAQQFNANASTGAFQHLSVLPGNYRVTCSRSFDPQANKSETGVADIHVGTEPPPPVRIQLSPISIVQGMLDEPASVSQSNSLQINQSGPQQQQRSVTLFPNGQPVFGNVPQSNVDDSGHFELSSVMPGSWTVNVQPRDYRHYVQSITWAQKPVQGSQIEVAPGESGPLHITMSASVGSLNATVEGCQAGAQCWVYAIPTDRKLDQQSMSPLGMAQNSTFQSDHVRPGSYVVFAVLAPFAATEEVTRVFAKQGKSVTVTESSQQSVSLTLIDNDSLYQMLVDSLQNPAP